jgi:RHS repeat-associated protein
VVSFYYGRWFEVSGGTLVRHIYLGQRLVAESPLAAPPLLTLAWLPGAQESILLARAMSEAVATRPQLYPVLGLTSPVALALAGGMLLLCIGLAVAPGRVRVGCVGYVHRGRVMLVVVLFAASLTPLPLARPAAAGGGPGPSQPPPIYPAYFVHSDHLGSTLRLTCFEQPGCTTGTVARHYRYSPYGEPKAYNASGTVVSLSSPLAEGFIPERLYTGQRWDTLAQLYYYGARFYDPKLATFMSLDPVRQYMNPYAYVGWNPVAFTDPTGMFAGLGSDIGGHFSSLGTTMPIEWSFDFMLETRFGSINPGAAGGFFGAVSSPGSLAGFVAGVLIAAIGLAIVALGLAVGLGLAAIGGLVGAGIAGITGGSMLGGASSAASMVFSHAAQTTQAELLDVAHGLGGTVEGLVRGLFGTLHGLATLNPDTLVAGLYGLFAASVMPRLGGSGGLNHPGPDANPTASSGSKVDNASIVHDVELGGRGPWVSQPYFGWIYNAYLGPGVEPGAYGQAYRALGTVGFGIPGTLLWSFGR